MQLTFNSGHWDILNYTYSMSRDSSVGKATVYGLDVQEIFIFFITSIPADQWPRGLRHEVSLLARTLGSGDRIPLKAWMSVFVYSVFVLSCV
jgi:hypothetical protein